MAATRQLSHVYPLGSRLNERGRLEVGGCDAIELAREFGTPAYVVAEQDLRARARAFVEAARSTHDGPTEVLFASKAFACTAVGRLLAEEGLGCDVASAGELHLALAAGFEPAAVYLHGNAKGDDELALALERGVGYVVIDALDEIERVQHAAETRGVRQHLGAGRRLVLEPGRALTANSTVTLYSVVSVKRTASTYVAVDGGMSDNLRPMLYGAVYEAQIANRFGGGTLCQVVGKHCESGDILVRDVELDEPRPGDVLVTPATGAYGHAMANNYNGVPRPPVIFCRDGDARVVVRRETLEDLTARDV